MPLDRFVEAQDRDGTYGRALAELRDGRKRSHWMWFVFPQERGLGRSPMSEHHAIDSVAEAAEYAAHPELGPRLRACCQALLGLEGIPPAVAVLGEVDALKLCSSMELFARADPDEPLFRAVRERYC